MARKQNTIMPLPIDLYLFVNGKVFSCVLVIGRDTKSRDVLV